MDGEELHCFNANHSLSLSASVAVAAFSSLPAAPLYIHRQIECRPSDGGVV